MAFLTSLPPNCLYSSGASRGQSCGASAAAHRQLQKPHRQQQWVNRSSRQVQVSRPTPWEHNQSGHCAALRLRPSSSIQILGDIEGVISASCLRAVRVGRRWASTEPSDRKRKLKQPFGDRASRLSSVRVPCVRGQQGLSPMQQRRPPP